MVFVFLLSLIIYLFVFTSVSYAHCPLCVAGAGVGLSISRFIGIDDSIFGLWMAAFLGALALWFSNSIKRKFFPFQSDLIYILFFVVTLLSFYKFGLINEHNGLIGNMPKLTFGVILGGIVFYLVDKLNGLIRKVKGKVLFAYQPIVFSLGAILLLSFLIYILINFFI